MSEAGDMNGANGEHSQTVAADPTPCVAQDKETEQKRRVGDGTPGPGRPKGSQNRATTAVRESITAFVENNANKVQELFDKVANDSPAKALDLYTRLAEFVIPKRNRTEIEGEIGIRGQLNIYD